MDNSRWRIKIVADGGYTHQIVGQKWVPGGALLSRGSLARRRARNIVQVHAHALNGSWECYHVVRIGLGAIWGDHGRRRSLHFTTPHLYLKKEWVYPLVSISLFFNQTTEVLLTAARLSESPAYWSNSCQGKRGESILTIRLLLNSEQSQTYSESGERAFRDITFLQISVELLKCCRIFNTTLTTAASAIFSVLAARKGMPFFSNDLLRSILLSLHIVHLK